MDSIGAHIRMWTRKRSNHGPKATAILTQSVLCIRQLERLPLLANASPHNKHLIVGS